MLVVEQTIDGHCGLHTHRQMFVDNSLTHCFGAFGDKGRGRKLNIGVAPDKVEGSLLKHW